MRTMDVCKKFVIGLGALATVACGGNQSQSGSGPYSNDLLNNLSQHLFMTEPVPGAAPPEAMPANSEPSPPVESSPDVEPEDASAPPAMDAAPEASVDAGRRRGGAAPRAAADAGARPAARPAPRRDGGR